MLAKLQSEFLDYIYHDKKDILKLIPYNEEEAILRLSIYKNNVISNLINSLKLTYPKILARIGHDLFSQLAKDYISAYKPISGNLDDYGDKLEFFLKKYPKLLNYPYLSYLAKLDWLKNIIFNYEDQSSIDLDLLQKIPAEEYPELKFVFTNNVCLLKAPYNLFQTIEEKKTCYIVMYRENFMVKTEELTKASWYFIRALIIGKNLESAYDIARRHNKEFDLNQDLQNILAKKMIHRLFY